MSIKVNPDWWKSIFDEVYLLTDSRSVCNKEITRMEVDIICEMIPIKPEHRILDLCGGHGRHSFELYSRGFRECTLIDYSQYLLDHAIAYAKEKNSPIKIIQSDARDTGLLSGSFNHILIMGNSLGYIQAPDADKNIIKEACRLLCPNGWLLIDITDGAAVNKGLNPNAWHEIGDDILVCRQREIDENRINVREIVMSRQNGLIRDETYSVRLYEPGDIVLLFEKAGMKNIKLKTDFSPHESGGDYGFMNRRIIATGQKN